MEATMTEIRALNTMGIIAFENWLNSKNEDGHTFVEPPRHLYFDNETSDAVIGVGSLPVEVLSKIHLATAVNEAIAPRLDDLLFNDGLWSGLALLYSNYLVPERDGRWDVKATHRYLMPSRQALRRVGERPYRHDVWGPSYLVRRFGPQLSRAFLAGPLGTFSDALDTLTYYNQAYLSVLLAVDALYIDLEGNLVDGNKRSERDVLRNARRGIPRDFIENARQIGYTHSLHHVRPETLIEQLNPVEFKTQIDNFRLRLAAGDLPWDTASSGVNSLMTAVA